MSHDKHEHEPRWDIIEKLSDKIDEDIDEAFRVNRMSFIEVDIALLMLREKLGQQKMELYNMYMKDERVDGKHIESKDEPTTKAPDNLYK
jgi:hypothetical protein